MDQGALTLVVLLSLVEGAFESTGGARVSVDVVRELAGVDFLDFSDGCVDLGLVASASAVFELDGVGRVSVDLVPGH